MKNIKKELQDLEICGKMEHYLKLQVFQLATWFRIAIMFEFLKTTWYLTWKFETPVASHRKMAALSIFASNSQKFNLFGR